MDAAQTESWKALDPPPDIAHSGCYIGTSGYNFEDWTGRFNPPDTLRRPRPAADLERLRFYQEYFSFVEINHTFDGEALIDSFSEIERYSKKSMKYAVRVHRNISHTRTRDRDAGIALMRKHIAAVSPLLETGRFYSFLIQLDDGVHRSQKGLDYLMSVASEAVRMRLDVHIEFRHNSWHHMYPLQALRDHGIGICNTEIPPLKHAFPLKAYATTEKGYIRYSGLNRRNWDREGRADTARGRAETMNAKYDYVYTEGEIEERIKGQMALRKKASSIAVVYNNCCRSQAVLNAIQNIRQLKQLGEFSRLKA